MIRSSGVFQLSRAKGACLSRCRAPLGYFLTEWREGRLGAFVMGLRHGWFCIGCCWLLMAILFAAGVMSLWWGAAITAFVIAGHQFPGQEVRAELLRYQDGPYDWEVRGKCGFATTFRYASD